MNLVGTWSFHTGLTICSTTAPQTLMLSIMPICFITTVEQICRFGTHTPSFLTSITV